MKETKPFSLSDAKAGAPYACRDGEPATVLKWDAKNPAFPLVGVFGHKDLPASWTNTGSHVPDSVATSGDLVMTPLGHIDGKPVFVGDVIVMRDDSEIEAMPTMRGFTMCRWPAPPRVYPETKMSDFDLHKAGCTWIGDGFNERVANAALRHAIDNGQVVPVEHFDEVVRERDDFALRCVGRAARDMEIAKAVREACMYYVSSLSQAYMQMKAIDLKSIIAKVSA